MDEEPATNTYRSFGKSPFSKLSRRCVAIIVVVCVLCILVIVLASTLGRKSKDDCPEGLHCDWRSIPPAQYMKDERCESICTTRPCIKTAEFALSRIDVTKDPCHDFYEFACGRFEEEAVLFPDANDAALTYHEMESELLLKLKDIIDSIPKKVTSTAPDFLLLARKFYDDCMKTDVHPDVLERNAMGKIIGEDGVLAWPLLNESLKNNENLLVEIMSTSIFYDANPFFSLRNVGERGETGKDLIFWFGEFDPEQLLNIHTAPPGPVDDDHIYVQYSSVIHKILLESGVSEPEIPHVSEKIREFEKKYKATVSKAANSIPDKFHHQDDIPRFHKFDCQDAEKRMKSIKWCKIVESLLEKIGKSEDSKVELRFHETMPIYEAINEVIQREYRDVVINYLVVKFIIHHLKYMPASLREMYYHNPQLFPEKNKFRVLTSRWQQCVDVTSDFFMILLELAYLNEKLTLSEKDQITLIGNKMKEVYISVVKRVPWLDEEVKEMLTGVVQTMKVIPGNSFMWQTGEGDHFMDSIAKVMRSDAASALKSNRQTLIEDVLQMKKLIRKEDSTHGTIGNWIEAGPFKIFPSERSEHVMRVLYGMLQFPMFLQGRPMYVEFATLGRSLLMILFRNTILAMKSDNTTEVFETSLKCLVNQMGPLETRKSTLKGKLDDRKRIYGNFYDTLATLASTEAYMKFLEDHTEEKGLPGLPLSKEQLFFISLAQMNCEKFNGDRYTNYPAEYFTPSKERVNMPLSNSEAFSRAFRCESGSNMNREKKCCLLGDGKPSEKCA